MIGARGMRRLVSMMGLWAFVLAPLPAETILLHSLAFDTPPPEGLSFLDPVLFTSINPDVPMGGDDGSLWQGRGLNSSLKGGARWAENGFELTLAPELDFSQNLAYSTLNGNGDYGWGLDRVQRYSKSPLVHLDFGDSEIRYRWNGWTAGLGSQSLWLGSAQRQAVLLSDNAGGFPHLDLGTAGMMPVSWLWGSFEGHLLWGGLYNSEQYVDGWNADPSNWRFFHGLVIGYSPKILPQWTFGGARLFYSPWKTISLFKVFESIDDTIWKQARGSSINGSSGEDDVDQLIAMYIDVKYPEQGFHGYVELARNDHSADLRNFLLEPDRTGGYVVGVEQTLPLAGFGSWFILCEIGDTSINVSGIMDPAGSWYRHGMNPDGYTLGGQVLGAAMGPGSNSQYIESGVRTNRWAASLSFERVDLDNDYAYTLLQSLSGKTGYDVLDVRMTGALHGSILWDSWEYAGMLGLVKELNNNFIAGHDLTNFVLNFQVTYKLGQKN